MGVVFSPDAKLFYASVRENGNIWIGDTATGQIVGSVNLNGVAHPLDRPLAPAVQPAQRFKGTYPGNMALTRDGRRLYVVDQGTCSVFAIDTSLMQQRHHHGTRRQDRPRGRRNLVGGVVRVGS